MMRAKLVLSVHLGIRVESEFLKENMSFLVMKPERDKYQFRITKRRAWIVMQDGDIFVFYTVYCYVLNVNCTSRIVKQIFDA